MVKVFATLFSLPKAGNTREEYEDAFYPEGSGERQGKRLRFAIADGATEGMLSGSWAKLLAKVFKRHWVDPGHTELWLDRACGSWVEWKREYIHQRELQNKPIQWFEEPGLEAGAFATVLGITLAGLENGLPGTWEAIAVGDSCLFQVRSNELIVKFPLEHSSDFSDRPVLISSNPAFNHRLLENVKITHGDLFIDDQFYLMTDALAAWFLRECESEQTPWLILRDLDTNDQAQSFEEWVDELRKSRQMRNDDVTLIRIEII